jgi:hypothetical protein
VLRLLEFEQQLVVLGLQVGGQQVVDIVEGDVVPVVGINVDLAFEGNVDVVVYSTKGTGYEQACYGQVYCEQACWSNEDCGQVYSFFRF